MNIDVVVLAGGDAGKVDPSLSGPKSLIEIGGRPMISYVMGALKGCPDLDEVIIALPEGADRTPFEDFTERIVEGTSGVVDAIYKSVHILGEIGYILIVSSDAPMIHSEAINEFLRNCQKEKAEIYYSVIRREVTEKVFPGTRRTYMRLKDGTFTGGNIHLVKKAAFVRNMSIGERLFNLRKHPLALISLLGLGFVLRYFTGRLDVEAVENKAGEILGAKVKAIITRYPELGIDVDKPEDLALVQAHLVGK
jgi:molybdopterin-guanine dinucleotide biosynthesis protein A